jgi:hypothetical protein
MAGLALLQSAMRRMFFHRQSSAVGRDIALEVAKYNLCHVMRLLQFVKLISGNGSVIISLFLLLSLVWNVVAWVGY